MFYQVLIEITEKVGTFGRNKEYFELDKTDLKEVEDRVVIPYFKKDDIQFDGYFLKNSEIRRITIKQTEKSAQELSKYENDNMAEGIIMYISPSDIISYDHHAEDITTSVFEQVKSQLSNVNYKSPVKDESIDFSKVFIVHGHDDLAKTEAARFIERLGLCAVILHEQASGGKTIIEKIEEHTSVGFAIALYTPCDIGSSVKEEVQRKRARQNVVFEHGFLIGKLGRQNVCALVKGDVETPNDISGVVYIPLDSHGAWNLAVAKELRKAGYKIDMNKVI